MKRRRLVLGALLCASAFGAGAVRAAGSRVAVLPAHVWRGNPANGEVVTQALRESLQREGFSVVPQERVDAVLREWRVDLSRPQPVAVLARLKSALGADYLVYPRVMSVGQSMSDADVYQATILVNVVGRSSASFFHTRQVGQEIRPQVRTPQGAVIRPSEAQEAASKLLELFYRKAR